MNQQALYAQVVKTDYETYTVKEGLSQNLVMAITQDKHGFIWMGTEDGLNRFDGHEFKVFRHKENDSTSLISSSIRALYADDDGSLWIGTEKGVCRYNPETEIFERFPIDYGNETKLNGGYVSQIQKDRNGSIWISYVGSGIDLIRTHTDTIFHYTIHWPGPYQLQNDMISCFQFMADGYTFVGSYEGLMVLDDEGKILSPEKAQKKYPWMSKFSHAVKKLWASADGTTLWIGTEVSGLYQVNLQTGKLTNFSTSNSELASNDILALYGDSKGNIWIGSDAIYKYNAQTQKVEWFKSNGMYIKNHTYAVFEDRDQNYWLGTARSGARKFRMQDGSFRHYHSNQGEGSLLSDEVLAFGEDQSGRIWVSAGGAALNYKTTEENSFVHAAPINTQLFSYTIKSIYKDGTGNFWMGGWDLGLVKFNPQTNLLDQYHPNNQKLPSRHIWDLAQDQQGNLWLGTLRDGLCRFKPETGEYKYYTYTAGDTTTLSNNDVQSLLVDKKNRLWVATSNGLSLMVPGTERFTSSLRIRSGDASSLATSTLLCLYEDPQGRIWVGTKGGGIAIVSYQHDKLLVERILKEQDGLPNNSIMAIQADAHNNLWVSTSSGIAKITYSSLNKINITSIPAFEGKEFLAQSNLRLSDGSLLFGSINGYYHFHPDNINFTPPAVEVIFTSLKIVNDEVKPGTKLHKHVPLTKSISLAEEIQLSHQDYAFTINFAPLTYNGQEKIQYAYMLENLDKDWQYTDASRRFVHYTNLTPGVYFLKVKASYDGKHWDGGVKTLKIVVNPPWWAHFWFKIVLSLAIASILWGIFQARVRFFKNQSKKLELLVQKRTLELQKSNREIQLLLQEVADQKESIESNNEELQLINEELEAQHDFMKEKSLELEKAQLTLREINQNLELLVEQRTQSLNNTVHELETFLYRASHDLRGPISSMMGLLLVSKMDGGTSLQNNSYTELLGSAVHKLERTLHKLLQKYTIQKEEIVVEIFTREKVTELLQPITEEIKHFRNEDFEVEIDPRLVFETDRKLLHILLLSLLENAFFYSENSSDTRVSLKISRLDKDIAIVVTDRGPGIKKELKDKIFNMFYRGSVLSKGNGLGLYLVKNIIEKLNGVIQLDTQEGSYARFTVLLPNQSTIQKNTVPQRAQEVL